MALRKSVPPGRRPPAVHSWTLVCVAGTVELYLGSTAAVSDLEQKLPILHVGEGPKPKAAGLGSVKAGGMRVSKKQENGPVEKNAKLPGKEKSRYYNAGPVPPCPVAQVHSAIVSFAKPQNMGVLVAEALNKMSHKIHAATLQVAHQKPQPTLEKFILPKRIYIIQQPRKC